MLAYNPMPGYDSLFTYLERVNRLNGGTSSSLFVIQHDRITAEYYAGTHSSDASARPTRADSQYNVASVRKSYIGFAAAWALHNGAIRSFDDPVLRYFSAGREDRERLQGVAIRHLLTHTHGLDSDKSGRLTRRFEPGTNWDYNNAGIRILTAILANATGRSIAELLNDHVFGPLGLRETGWRTAASDLLVPVADDLDTSLPLDSNADGSEGNLFVSARELAYWGYLHLKLGTINKEQIVPTDLIQTIISDQSPRRLPAAHPRNGCLWMVKKGESSQCLIGNNVPKDSFEIVGLYGPILLVVPELDLVVVRMANRVGNYADDKGSYIHYLKEFSDLAVAAARANIS